MRNEPELWTFIGKCLARGESIVLLTVVESIGSSPGRTGFKMAVSDGAICGSIGGGVMEVALVEKSRAILKGGSAPDSAPIRQVHRKNIPESSGMICSGEQTVIINKLEPENADVVSAVLEAFETENRSLSFTKDSIALTDSEEPEGFIREDDFVYTERIGRCSDLFIIGGGHCSLALSEIMSFVGFRISVFDDRPDLNTLRKNEFADRVSILGSYDGIADLVPSGGSNYVVVMTLGYKYDKVVIRKLLGGDFAYFGVLGSNAKMAVLLKELKEEGFDPERLEAIYTPIGLGINSRTPEEIAVSIAAEIISVKNGADNK